MIAQERFPLLSTRPRSANGPQILLDGLFAHPACALLTRHRLFAAIFLIKLIVSGESLGFLACALDVCFQNTRK